MPYALNSIYKPAINRAAHRSEVEDIQHGGVELSVFVAGREAVYGTEGRTRRAIPKPSQDTPVRTRGSHDHPVFDLRQVEAERTFRTRTHETGRPELSVGDLPLNLRLRLVAGRALVDDGTRRKLWIQHAGTVSQRAAAGSAVLHIT